jgi:peptidoglycan hydrolase-like protein with peptidoglycan-binding domain
MIIKKGSKGEEVKEIQIFLGLEDDGVFGPNTEKAVKIWQKTNGLLDDGIVGPATRNAMGLIDTDFQKNNIKEEGSILINKTSFTQE